MSTPPVLLTGGSGVVGTALRDVLNPSEYIALTRRRAIDGPAESVTGDVRDPLLGLTTDAYDALASRVGAVVHSAADTQLNSATEELAETNLVGTRHLVDFCVRAGVPLIQVSSAYTHCLGRPENAGRSLPYAESKRTAEELVRSADVSAMIVRPSIVAGDSRTGEISEFQGLHRLCGGVLLGQFPIWPSGPTGIVDFVPQDLVARVIAACARGEIQPDGDEVWITAGDQGLTVDRLVAALDELATERGRDFTPPRMVPLDTYDRLIGPVFVKSLPPDMRRMVTSVFAHVAPYINVSTPFPSSGGVIDAVGGYGGSMTDILKRSLRYWLAAHGHERIPDMREKSLAG